MRTVFRWGNLEKGDRLEVIGLDARIILKLISDGIGESGLV
jgi:hypothetical protein